MNNNLTVEEMRKVFIAMGAYIKEHDLRRNDEWSDTYYKLQEIYTEALEKEVIS